MANYPKLLDTARNEKCDLCELGNAHLYLTKTGCQWRLLPLDFPKWQLVYNYFSGWKKQEVIALIRENLVELVRKRE